MDFNSQSGSPFGNVQVHSFTLSYIPGNVKCDFRAFLSAHMFASLCLGREPKVRVTTSNVNPNQPYSHYKAYAHDVDHCFMLHPKLQEGQS
jgi:hypothetical protein